MAPKVVSPRFTTLNWERGGDEVCSVQLFNLVSRVMSKIVVECDQTYIVIRKANKPRHKNSPPWQPPRQVVRRCPSIQHTACYGLYSN